MGASQYLIQFNLWIVFDTCRNCLYEIDFVFIFLHTGNGGINICSLNRLFLSYLFNSIRDY